ncbi:hypothetical protein MMC16_003256 [Acarospora aff. strigata]|nr:hypothetical protein [Acarospora aff. strigata]
MSIGRDVYCDTRLILAKLEKLFPDGALGAQQPDQNAIEGLLQKWTSDGGVFNRAAQLIPPDMPLLNDSKFTKDREELTGRSWAKADVVKLRPEALADMKDMFNFLETTLLRDSREWILKTEKLSLADIEAIWPFHWLADMKGALPPDVISEELYPKVFSWIGRFKKAISAAKSSAPKPARLKGADAVKQIVAAEYAEDEEDVDQSDPSGLKKGEDVQVWPIDSGFGHKDRGRLVSLTSKEVVIAKQSKVGAKEIHVRTPRHGFRIAKATVDAAGKL